MGDILIKADVGLVFSLSRHTSPERRHTGSASMVKETILTSVTEKRRGKVDEEPL